MDGRDIKRYLRVDFGLATIEGRINTCSSDSHRDGSEYDWFLKESAQQLQIPTKLLSGPEHRLAVYSSLVALFGELPIPVGRVEFRRVKRTKRNLCIMGGLTQSWRF